MVLTLVMLVLLFGCYILCAVLVWFTEHVIAPRNTEPVDAASLPRTNTL